MMKNNFYPRKAFFVFFLKTIQLCFLVVFLFVVIEVLVRVYTGNAIFTPNVFIEDKKPLDYTLKEKYSGRVFQFGRFIRISTDREGRRSFSNAPVDSKIVVNLIGDSQVFGWGLSDNETIASRLQNKLGESYAVINYGVPGYGPDDYKRIANNLPVAEKKIVFFTEENDLWDGYRVFKKTGVKCGYLTGSLAIYNIIKSCFFYDSRAVQLAASAENFFKKDVHLTPLGLSKKTRIVAKVLSMRVKKIFNDISRSNDDVTFIDIPWKGRFSETWRKSSYPVVDSEIVTQKVFGDDKYKVLERFLETPNAGELYIPEDGHLSEKGADFLATIIAEKLLSDKK